MQVQQDSTILPIYQAKLLAYQLQRSRCKSLKQADGEQLFYAIYDACEAHPDIDVVYQPDELRSTRGGINLANDIVGDYSYLRSTDAIIAIREGEEKLWKMQLPVIDHLLEYATRYIEAVQPDVTARNRKLFCEVE